MHQGAAAGPNMAAQGAGQGQPLAHAGQQQPLGGGSAFAEPGLAPVNHISQQPAGHERGGGAKAAAGKAERAIDQFYEEYAAKKERTIRENKYVISSL